MKGNYYIERNNGQDSAISCIEVSNMPIPDSALTSIQTNLAHTVEQQLNEQLYNAGIITQEMYRAAKQGIEQAAKERKTLQ